MTELSKRWDDEVNQEARRKVYNYATANLVGLKTLT